MAGAHEHAEHVAHAGGGHDHGGGHEPNPLGMYVGITMAALGVLLAFCSAKVGGERTELIQSLVAKSNAEAQYHAQDVKHRVAFLDLQLAHAEGFSTGAEPNLNKADVLMMADTVERYLDESGLAKAWVATYDPVITAHVEASDWYEDAQLLAEIGVVVASVGLLLKRREAWYISLILGFCSIAIVGWTWVGLRGPVATAEEQIEEKGKEFSDARAAHKTTDAENALVKSIRAWAGQPSVGDAPPPQPAPGGDAAGPH